MCFPVISDGLVAVRSMTQTVKRQVPLLVLSANPTYVCDNVHLPDELLQHYQLHYNQTDPTPLPLTARAMGSKASVQASIKEMSRAGNSITSKERVSNGMERESSARAELPSSAWNVGANGGVYVGRRHTLHQEPQDPRDWAAILDEKVEEIRELKKENSALHEENLQLKAELEELKAKQLADPFSHSRLSVSNEHLSHSRLSISSGISSHSGRTDASGAFSSSPLPPGSPWSTGNGLSPDPKRKSSNSRHQRRHLVQMNDIEAYGKGLNPNQAHYIIRTPSVGTNSTKDSLEDDELNGNDEEHEDS